MASHLNTDGTEETAGITESKSEQELEQDPALNCPYPVGSTRPSTRGCVVLFYTAQTLLHMVKYSSIPDTPPVGTPHLWGPFPSVMASLCQLGIS